MIEHAHSYVARGWPVFRLYEVAGAHCSCGKPNCRSPGKHPRIKGGLTKATTDRIQIEKWWDRFPASSIGIVTGKPSGLVALDIDKDKGGFDSLAQLVDKIGAIPDTLTQKTGGGGRHYFFSTPTVTIRNSAGRLGSGIDIRGDGGYVVVPPSVHISGQSYVWLRDSITTPLATFPESLIELLISQPTQPVELIANVDIPKGSRNVTLASIGGKLRADGKSRQENKVRLAEINATRCHPLLSPQEVAQIAESVSRYPINTESKVLKYQFVDWLKSLDGPDDPITCHVLHMISGYMDQHGGNCYPNIEDIAAVSKLNERTVRRHLDKAVDEGWIVRYAQPIGNGKRISYGYLVPPDLLDSGHRVHTHRTESPLNTP